MFSTESCYCGAYTTLLGLSVLCTYAMMELRLTENENLKVFDASKTALEERFKITLNGRGFSVYEAERREGIKTYMQLHTVNMVSSTHRQMETELKLLLSKWMTIDEAETLAKHIINESMRQYKAWEKSTETTMSEVGVLRATIGDQ